MCRHVKVMAFLARLSEQERAQVRCSVAALPAATPQDPSRSMADSDGDDALVPDEWEGDEGDEGEAYVLTAELVAFLSGLEAEVPCPRVCGYHPTRAELVSTEQCEVVVL